MSITRFAPIEYVLDSQQQRWMLPKSTSGAADILDSYNNSSPDEENIIAAVPCCGLAALLGCMACYVIPPVGITFSKCISYFGVGACAAGACTYGHERYRQSTQNKIQQYVAAHGWADFTEVQPTPSARCFVV